jgi:hypothetical protein
VHDALVAELDALGSHERCARVAQEPRHGRRTSIAARIEKYSNSGVAPFHFISNQIHKK